MPCLTEKPFERQARHTMLALEFALKETTLTWCETTQRTKLAKFCLVLLDRCSDKSSEYCRRESQIEVSNCKGRCGFQCHYILQSMAQTSLNQVNDYSLLNARPKWQPPSFNEALQVLLLLHPKKEFVSKGEKNIRIMQCASFLELH
jgi:hypothetical protein